MSGFILIGLLLVVLFTILFLALWSVIAFWISIVCVLVATVLKEVWNAVTRRGS